MPAPLTASFTGALVHGARAWRRVADEVLRQHGVSEAAAGPLLELGRSGDGLRQRALAESLGIEDPSLVRLLDGLERAGLLARREDPTDRRAKTLHLTPAGTALLAGIERDLQALRNQVLAGIDSADLAVAHRVVERVEQASHRLRTGDDGVVGPGAEEGR